MAAIEDPNRGRIVWDGTKTPLKTALFLVVCFAWLVPGLVGHDPWKFDEAVVFGLVNGIVQSGDWVMFRIAGEPYFDKAPLFVWVGALFAKAFGGILAVHDAARLASGVFVAATLAFVALASRELMGDRTVRLSVLVLIGCVGLLLRAHEMSTDLAGLAGASLGLYGLALARRRHVLGGALAGLGMGMGFLGDGFLPAGVVAATVILLPATSPFWRTRAHAVTAATAFAVAAPVMAAWPLLLAAASPVWLQVWLDNAAASRWSDPFVNGDPLDILYFIKILPWYAWPAWPLAAWALWRSRRGLLERRDLMFALTAFIAAIIVVSVFGAAHEVNGLLLLVPLALLGAAEVDTLPRGAASALDWFGMMTFLLFGAVVWAVWIAALTGGPEVAAAWIAREVPGYKYRFSFVAFALALLLTLIWIVVVARSLRTPRRALVNWTAGMTMVWMLMMTLGLPLVDQARSYRAVSGRIVSQLPADFTCIARRNVGEAQRALLDYFANIRTVREELPAADRCRALLVQASPLRIPPVSTEWSEVWRGSRPGDRHELFILYKRDITPRPAALPPARSNA